MVGGQGKKPGCFVTSDELFDDGVANAGSVFRRGNQVIRPAGPHSAAVHSLLKHLEKVGYNGAPAAIALEDSTETVSYIPGSVPAPPYEDWCLSDETLYKIAQLQWRYHDAAQTFVPEPHSVWNTGLADPLSVGIVCHNDLGPGNVVFEHREPNGFIDWDFAAPGRALWDIARTARAWIPLDNPDSAATYGLGGLDPFTRLRVFCDGYGLDGEHRHDLVDILELCNAVSTAYVRSQFEAGKPSFVKMWNDYNLDVLYKKRGEWIADNKSSLYDAVR
jgi:hypothetical protein